MTVFADYPGDVTQGTSNVRDTITQYYRDGSTMSVTGESVVGKFYTYGAGGEYPSCPGCTWTTTRTGAADSPRCETTIRDMAGRPIRAIRPGWAASGTVTRTTQLDYYSPTATSGNAGHLWKSSESGGDAPAIAQTIYKYDLLGAVQFSGQDLNGNNDLTPTSTGRMTQTVTQYYEYADGAYWEVSRSWVYPTDNDGTSKEVGSQWRRLRTSASDPASVTKSVDVSLNQTITQTTFDRTNHLRTESTTFPDAGTNTATRTRHGGRLVETTSQTGVDTQYQYDDLGRHNKVIGRGGRTDSETGYDSLGRVAWTKTKDKDGNDAQTDYVYYAPTEAFPGQVHYVQIPGGLKTYYKYNDRGQTTHVWGNVPQPTETVYDTTYGDQTYLKTYRTGNDTVWAGETWPGDSLTADITRWEYHTATGLLNSKTYADQTPAAQSVLYSYYSDGRLHVRTWARNVTTTYGYAINTGDMNAISYSDGTPAVGFTFDRLGRRLTATEGTGPLMGTHTFAYDPNSLQPLTETLSGGIYPTDHDRVITQVYEGAQGGTVPGRYAGVKVEASDASETYYAAAYGYDQLGRLNHVMGPGLPTGDGINNGAWYSFLSGSDLTQTLWYKGTLNGQTVVRGWTQWTYEPQRDLTTAIQNYWGSDSSHLISQYGHTYNAHGQREYKDRIGLAFASSPFYEVYHYDDRGGLADAMYYSGTYGSGIADTAKDHTYTYDPIGNRKQSRDGQAPSATTVTYQTNAFNQYPRTSSPQAVAQGLQYDDDGNLTEYYVTGDMDCSGSTGFSDIDYFVAAIPDNQAAWTALYQARNGGANPPCDFLTGDINGDGHVTFADIDPFTALIASTALWVRYTWDAENRLTSAEQLPHLTSPVSQLTTFAYDYAGRRIQTSVYNWTGTQWSALPVVQRRYIWDGWRVLLELDGADAIVRKYTWGLDLAGQAGSVNSLGAAGGIGGLLALEAPETVGGSPRYVYFYDTNGNVGQVVDLATASADASVKAHYEYDPFGTRSNNAAPNEYDQPFRFSTKQFDAETGLGYWGLRYYSPMLGRWISRDPIGEADGPNVFQYAWNNAIDEHDSVGLTSSGRNTIGGSIALGNAFSAAYAAIAAIRAAQTVALAYAAYYTALRAIDEIETLIGAIRGDLNYRFRTLRDQAGRALDESLARLRVDLHDPNPGPDPTPEPEPKPKPKPKGPGNDWVPPDYTDKGCNPCVPPVGTRSYRVDTVPPSKPHYPYKGTHTHHYVMQQTPPSAGCRCVSTA